MRSDRHRPYAAAVGVAGLVVAGAQAIWAPASPSAELVLLTAVALVAFVVPLRIHQSGTVHAITLDETLIVAMAFVVDHGHVPAALAIASLVGFTLVRRDVLKALFNAGQKALGATAALTVFRALATGSDVLALRSVVAAAAATLVFALVTYVMLYELFRRLGGVSLREFIAGSGRAAALGWVGNTTTGLVLAVVVVAEPAGAVLVAVLMVGLFLGYRSYAAVLEDRDRNERLHDVTSILADPQRIGALDDLLERLCELFGARSAELLVRQPRDGAPELYRRTDATRDGPTSSLRAVVAGSSPLLVADSVGEQPTSLAAPLIVDGTTIGGLSLSDRQGLEPWDTSDLKLLAAISNEVAMAARNVELLATIEEESRKLRNVVAAASDGIVMLDEVGVIATWNPAMERATGIPASAAMGRPWYEVVRAADTPDGIHEAAASATIAALSGRRVDDPVDVHVARGAERRWLRCTFSPIDHDGERGAVLVARDVTNDVEAEQLKSDFIATVSHELRTPLTPLKGFLSTAAHRWRDLSPEQIDEMLASMSRQTDRLEALVADLLVIADIDRGASGLQEEMTDLVKVARRAVEVEASPFDADRVRIETPLGSPVIALADQPAVTRIVRALVSNAVKHTSGAITVRVDRDDGEARIEVADEGPGISPWDEQRVFERFGRLGDHLTRTQGPGLGLAIARGLAERVGGQLELRSVVGEGSAFILRLPTVEQTPLVDAGT